MTYETPSSFNRRVPSDGDIVRFDLKRCPWNALRDVIYAQQNTNISRLDVCKALKVLYPDEVQFQNMSSQDVEQPKARGGVLKPCLTPSDMWAMSHVFSFINEVNHTLNPPSGMNPM